MGIYPQTAHPGVLRETCRFPPSPKVPTVKSHVILALGFLGVVENVIFCANCAHGGFFGFFVKSSTPSSSFYFYCFLKLIFIFFYIYFFIFFIFFLFFYPPVTGLPTQPWCKCPDLHARSDVLANVQEFRSLRRSPSWRMIVRSSSSLKISGRVGHISLTRSTRVDRLSGFRPFSNDISGRFDLE
jgi:hypothetical protein